MAIRLPRIRESHDRCHVRGDVPELLRWKAMAGFEQAGQGRVVKSPSPKILSNRNELVKMMVLAATSNSKPGRERYSFQVLWCSNSGRIIM